MSMQDSKADRVQSTLSPLPGKQRLSLLGLLLFSLIVADMSFAQVSKASRTADPLEAQDVGETNLNEEIVKAAARDARMKWWRGARFGCFVHWGPSAQLAANGEEERVAVIPIHAPC